jgi:hypothetical protein
MFFAALTLSLQLTDAAQSVRAPVELNAIMRPVVAHPAALYAAKLGTGALVLYGAHSLRRHGHPRAAFWYLVVINSVQAAVVLHNVHR